MRTVISNGHTIEFQGITLTGIEQIRYDGKVMSSKHTVLGGTHVFRVKEGNEDIDYEVKIGVRWHGFTSYAIVRRNGIIIYTDN